MATDGPTMRTPRDMVLLADCRRCTHVLGVFHVVHTGTLRLGRLTCLACGAVDTPARVRSLFISEAASLGVDGPLRFEVALVDGIIEWP